ncbi:hypothetical protein UlMin_026094 [Ulmus minor]
MASKSPPLFQTLLFHLMFLLFLNTTQSNPTKPKPSSFSQDLQGSQKGQNLSGIFELKQYLMKFGYLDNYNVVQNNLDDKNDEFDDVLEHAIKSYQQNYKLEVTGTLNPSTVKQMMMPRCGVPDLIPQKAKKKHHNHHHNRKLIIHSVSHYSFFQGSPRWPPSKTHLTYRFRSSVLVYGTENISSIVARAFEKWAQVSHFSFEMVSATTKVANIEIGFHRGSHGDNLPFDGHLGTLAHAYSPPIGLFHFDADEAWSENPGPNEVDLESVALHEIGHLLGLGHNLNDVGSIMYPSVNLGTTKRYLNADDIEGVRALYGLN